MAININTILNWFKTGKMPTEQQFSDSWQSFWHKDEIIPQAVVENLETDLVSKAEQQDFVYHLTDPKAHNEIWQSFVQESYKVIDTYVINGVYNVTVEDFETTIRYNGTAAINVVLSTTVPYTLGKRFRIYQGGSGQITFSVNGYMLRHGSDVLPKLYGAYSTAAVEITDVSPATAYVYGKLELA